jgi:hypothetical protein
MRWLPLGNDGGFGEHDHALGSERFAERYALDAGDEQQERASPVFDWTRAQIVLLEAYEAAP